MIEKIIMKKSIPVFLTTLLITSIIGIPLGYYTVPLGVLIGYVIGLGALMLTASFTDALLTYQTQVKAFAGILFIVKIGLYALGIFVAIKLPTIFHYGGVVLGYFVVKITIYLISVKNKGGEWGAD